MSMARKDDTNPLCQAVWMLCMSDIPASVHEAFDLPPNWLKGMRLYFPALKSSLLVTIFSASFPMHSISWMGQCDLG